MDEVTKVRIEKMFPTLDERALRRYLAIEAQGIGKGGITAVSKLTGVSRTTITKGINELSIETDEKMVRIRKSGGGRKKAVDKHKNLSEELEKLLENSTVGNPANPLKWTAKSLRKLSSILEGKGYEVSHKTVGEILINLGYSLQMNKKCLQNGEAHPDRNEQFEFINNKAKLFMCEKEPVISIDTKKKEIIGNFKNEGRDYHKKGEAIKVLDHDFLIKELGKVNPYGVYDITNNKGFINLGTSSDTSEFAVESIRRWYYSIGLKYYPNARKIYINCDCGGSNSYRVKLWKTELQKLADELNIEIHVSHFPPGTSKWNKIEHRLFCYISKSWRGKPLLSIEATVDLIGATTTTKGLTVDCIVDTNKYEKGINVSKEEFDNINIEREDFHGEWNYTIKPN